MVRAWRTTPDLEPSRLASALTYSANQDRVRLHALNANLTFEVIYELPLTMPTEAFPTFDGGMQLDTAELSHRYSASGVLLWTGPSVPYAIEDGKGGAWDLINVGRLRHRDAQGRWSRPFAPVAPSYFYGVHESGDLLVLSGPRAGPFELVRVRSHSNGALSFSRRSLPLSFSPISIGGVGTFGVVGDRWLQYADDEALHALELPISLPHGEAILIDGFEPRVP